MLNEKVVDQMLQKIVPLPVPVHLHSLDFDFSQFNQIYQNANDRPIPTPPLREPHADAVWSVTDGDELRNRRTFTEPSGKRIVASA